jgi:hypothetical protein
VSGLAFGFLAAAEEAKIYECKDAKGEVVYQDEPCLEPPPVKTKPPAVAKPPATAKPPAAAKPKAAAKSKAQAQLPVAPQHQAVQESAPGEKPWRAAFPPSPRPRTRPTPGGPVGGRWETPEKALKTFLDAVKAGDRSLVWSSLSSSASVDMGPDPAALPLDKLRETVGSFTGYVDEGEAGPFWSIRALRAGTRPKWILFERTGTGEWKIAGI